MMKVKDLISELLDHFNIDDDVYISVMDKNGEFDFYSIDGLENTSCEYRNNPTLATAGVK